jgi:trimeric autotransporter adhesin
MKQNPGSPIQLKTSTPPFLVAIALVLACFGLSAPNAFGVVPAPDGGYPGNNTAEGADALFSLTSGIDNTGLGFQALYRNNTGNFNTAEGFRSLFNNNTGANNTATGVQALFSNTTGNYNTALGVNALYRNTTGRENTAAGVQALFNNTGGIYNTALGLSALYRNTTGTDNTATGWQALFNNTTGFDNTANGYQALWSNTNGTRNTATGWQALSHNTTGGNGNTATGHQALWSNTTGGSNTATGWLALSNNISGFNNIALGFQAGSHLITGDNNIDIGHTGFAGESNTIRIGDVQTATYIAGISGRTATNGAPVFVAYNGKLGTVTSSRRFKKDIADMAAASEALLALRPVTFRYKPELDKAGIPQYGLVAEEVAEVNPDLVVRDENGEIYTVRYEAVNAMLLNEFLKEHRQVEQQGRKMQEQEASITQLKSTMAQQQKESQSIAAQQQKEIQSLAATVKEQASLIEKVSAQLEASNPAPQVVLNNQ